MVITINRPEVRNVINSTVHSAIGLALVEADSDADVRCVVITGTGEKGFCAGGNDQGIGLFGTHDIGCCLHGEPYRYSFVGHRHPNGPFEVIFDIFFKGRGFGNVKHPAEGLFLFKKRHPVASVSQSPRGLHTRRAAANNHGFFQGLGWIDILEFDFTTG